MSNRRVFISYSHDSEQHCSRVLALAERLREDGIETLLDQYLNGAPEMGWPRWMLDQLDIADFVLVVCTEIYYRRFRGHEVPGIGKGADWEGALITQEIYDSRSRKLKFVPIFVSHPFNESWIPEPLRSYTHYDLTKAEDYQGLYDLLLQQSGVEPHPVGTPRFKPRRRGIPLTFDTQTGTAIVSPRNSSTPARPGSAARRKATTAPATDGLIAPNPLSTVIASAAVDKGGISHIAISKVDDSLKFECNFGTGPTEVYFVRQTQPGLIETLVLQKIHESKWDAPFGRMLFQLLVPKELRQWWYELEHVVLSVDSFAALIPWEIVVPFVPNKEKDGKVAWSDEISMPFALRASVVRQTLAPKLEQPTSHNMARTALVVGNPSTERFEEAFRGKRGKRLVAPPALPGSEIAVESVAKVFCRAGYMVHIISGQDSSAVSVFEQLLLPRRFLHISAHGVFNLPHKDGHVRTGILLSQGLLVTTAEISAGESLPEVVFLDCFHVGNGFQSNAFAATMARELCVAGVRCLVVAGWAVDDYAAKLFCEAFYESLLEKGQPFAQAVSVARLAVWHIFPDDVTWGAFQAYGDPDWIARP